MDGWNVRVTSTHHNITPLPQSHHSDLERATKHIKPEWLSAVTKLSLALSRSHHHVPTHVFRGARIDIAVVCSTSRSTLESCVSILIIVQWSLA